MTFNQWCDENRINGNWREALYHHLRAKHGEHLEETSEPQWEQGWGIILSEAVTMATDTSAWITDLGEET